MAGLGVGVSVAARAQDGKYVQDEEAGEDGPDEEGEGNDGLVGAAESTGAPRHAGPVGDGNSTSKPKDDGYGE